VKFERTQRFDSDFRALPREHQKSFIALMPDFNAACDAYIAANGGYVWPKRLRVSKMSSAKGLWEMTWSFASPDGRATFEFVTKPDGVWLRWRRIGDHDVFLEP
jgi:hypothetical protein